jgi:hypothetical protein
MMKMMLAAALLVMPDGEDPGFVVHEWGTFTSLSGENSFALEWRPLAGPSDLPKFVYGPGANGPRNLFTKEAISTVRMETPVLYVYSDREREISAKVQFPRGRITEWYPKAAGLRNGIDWGKVRVLPGSKAPLPQDGKPSHYYPAREVDASPLQVGAEVEKFLFYRGVGHFGLPLQARRHLDDTVILTTSGAPVDRVILFENRGGKVGYRVVDRIDGKARLERPALDGTVAGVRAELERSLIAQGLFTKEAAAMLETWKDTWFEEGLRAFYLVPRPATDEILPLDIQPAPKACVRVLVGRAEILTPAFEARVERVVERFDSEDIAVRQAAAAELKGLGRFAHPVLMQLAPSLRNKESQARVYDLLYR